MHYAICIQCPFSLRPMVVPLEKPCNITFMHHDHMHYEIINCSLLLCLGKQ